MITAMLSLVAVASAPAEIQVEERTELALMTRTVLGVERQVVQTTKTRREFVPSEDGMGPTRLILSGEDGYSVYVGDRNKLTTYTFEGDGKPTVTTIGGDEAVKNMKVNLAGLADTIKTTESRWLDEYKMIAGVQCRLHYQRQKFGPGSFQDMEFDGGDTETLEWIDVSKEDGLIMESTMYSIDDGERRMISYRRTIDFTKSKIATPKNWPNITDDQYCRPVTSKKAD